MSHNADCDASACTYGCPSSDEREVARFRLPMQVRGMDRLVTYLEQSYGKGLLMRQDGDWMLVLLPQTGAGAPATTGG